MDESILISVKKMLGIDASYDDFDIDIIMSINSAIHTLYQVGYSNAKNFIVECTEQTWGDLTGGNPGGVLSLIKTYIYVKVRTLFDPPTSSFVLTSLENQTKELEWRIYAEMEGGFANDDEDESEDTNKPGGSCGDVEDDPESDDSCEGNNPWEGVPGNGPDESSGLPDTLRRLRNEMGRP